MKKVLLQIDACKNTGSTGKISEDIGRVAISQGWESWKVYSRMHRDSQPSKSHLIEVGSKVGFYQSVLETRLFDNHCLGIANKNATKKLISQIEEIKPDIIQLHDIKGYFLNIKTLFEYLATKDIPIVWTLHSCWQFTGHCGYFDFAGCERWKEGCYGCPNKRSYPESWLFDRSNKNWNEKKELFRKVKNLTLVPVSKWLSNLVGESFLKDLPRIVIHNGIDTSAFCVSNTNLVKEKYGLKDQFTIIGVASPWSRRKGLDDFIKLRDELSEKYQIVLVGLESNQISMLPQGIVGISRTESREELASLYSFSSVFFNPTYEDNFPTTNIEALACGTPVVTYKTGGSPEAIDDLTGFVLEKGDYKKMRNIVEVISAKRKEYRETCKTRANKYFNKDRQFMKYVEMYESILTGGGGYKYIICRPIASLKSCRIAA